MDADLFVAQHYQSIVDRVNSDGVGSLSENDRVIWYVVSARCEKDMEGFESIFVQFVSEPELEDLIASIKYIDEPEVASLFEAAHQALRTAGFHDKDKPSYYQLGPELKRKLGEIAGVLGDRLWGLDEKLARLIDGNATVSQGE
jgi:hypothetical protein